MGGGGSSKKRKAYNTGSSGDKDSEVGKNSNSGLIIVLTAANVIGESVDLNHQVQRTTHHHPIAIVSTSLTNRSDNTSINLWRR
jgi:hypothetical protein